jgi:hypothetical protein
MSSEIVIARSDEDRDIPRVVAGVGGVPSKFVLAG